MSPTILLFTCLALIAPSFSQSAENPPNMDSVACTPDHIWAGAQSKVEWHIRDAKHVTIDVGNGPVPYDKRGTFVVTPSATQHYHFVAKNAVGESKKTITIHVDAPTHVRDSLWQWSLPLKGMISPETDDHPRAFLYIPPDCQKLRGVIIGQHNMLEEPILEHVTVRQALANANMAAIWVSPAFDGNFSFTKNPQAPLLFQQMMDGLAAASGYSELSQAPVVWIGHSAMASAPYHFAAWDAQQARAQNKPHRAAAAISIKGIFPGVHDDNSPVYENTDLAGVPILFFNGEYEDAMGRADHALRFRNATPGVVLSMVADVGGGHFDWNDHACNTIAQFLRKLAQYRLPDELAANGSGTLKEIDPAKQGWLVDRWRKGQKPTAAPAPVASYQGKREEAFWFFDEEHATQVDQFYRQPKSNYQLLAYKQNGKIVEQANNHQQVNLAFLPERFGDGLTFRLDTDFLNQVPKVSERLSSWTGKPAGSPIDHASGHEPITLCPICGPVVQLSPDTFALRFNRVGTNNLKGGRTRDIWLMATHPGDDHTARAVQQALLNIPYPLTQGETQQISFPEIPDQKVGAASLRLRATSSAPPTLSAVVHYYVSEGPAHITGDTLTFTKLPPRSKFPVKITVVATQYGRIIEPLLQTATPVSRSFHLLEK